MMSAKTARINIHIPLDEPLREYHRAVALLATKYAPVGGSVVDIGCGLGHVLGLLAEMAPTLVLTGADIDSECLRRTKSRVPAAETVLIPDLAR